MKIDPRISLIEERLKGIRRVIAVSSGKGGVGKSLVSSALALTLARRGLRTGLFDMDFTSPASHIILGVGDAQPEEADGIVPPVVHGLKYMSIIHYVHDRASPLRGVDLSNVVTELLAVTIWGKLDFLVIDMPPGISDVVLDVLRLIRKAEFLVVTTPSRLAFETVRKLIDLLLELGVPVLGVIENMKMGSSDRIRREVEGRGLNFWGEVPFDPRLEESIGDAGRLMRTEFGRAIERMAAEKLGIT
ncbi:MAG: AAA domain protein [Candidatus Bathyarchaeota archaeon B63]|nr:MAG: AAA domain protein [Candidatus Bathyarchaeota archaeon B63]